MTMESTGVSFTAPPPCVCWDACRTSAGLWTLLRPSWLCPAPRALPNVAWPCDRTLQRLERFLCTGFPREPLHAVIAALDQPLPQCLVRHHLTHAVGNTVHLFRVHQHPGVSNQFPRAIAVRSYDRTAAGH